MRKHSSSAVPARSQVLCLTCRPLAWHVTTNSKRPCSEVHDARTCWTSRAMEVHVGATGVAADVRRRPGSRRPLDARRRRSWSTAVAPDKWSNPAGSGVIMAALPWNPATWDSSHVVASKTIRELPGVQPRKTTRSLSTLQRGVAQICGSVNFAKRRTLAPSCCRHAGQVDPVSAATPRRT